ncbi:uncharacterized protein METZ01_LOCUS368600 [marine metagenome]|uniref:Uncharacterized protein n=1 Tax=marine metagenome TaxID=408172 RepID=A0A382T103_9ZZZZ
MLLVVVNLFERNKVISINIQQNANVIRTFRISITLL